MSLTSTSAQSRTYPSSRGEGGLIGHCIGQGLYFPRPYATDGVLPSEAE
jgi:hypothetical protein